MKIIFFGTPEYVIPVLELLHKTYNRPNHERELIAVVTQEPKKVGREQTIERSAVDNWAFRHKIQIITNLNEVPEADLGVVAAYGNIIPQNIISKFSKGLLNIHPSLLPKYRGASPIQSAIIAGDTLTGVSVLLMDEQMDHGPLISQFKEEILNDDTNETLRTRLFERSAQFLIDLIPNYLNGKVKPKEQKHDEATFTKLIKKDDGFIKNPLKDPLTTDKLFRAMQPWPGIWTLITINKEPLRLKVNKLHLEGSELVLDEVQLEGKNPVSWDQFSAGYPDYKFGDN